MTLVITHPDTGELEETLYMSFGHLPEHELPIRINGILEQYRSGNLALDGIFQATSNGKRVGVLFSQYRADGVVMGWVPKMIDGISIEPFFEPFDAFCRQRQAVAALLLVDLGQQFDKQTLVSMGKFELLSDLVNLVVPVTEEKIITDIDTEKRLQFLPMSHCSENSFERMTEVVRQTYRKTLDFPQLMQIAPVDKILYGYQAAAVFLPELWFFIQKDGLDIGALLLTDQPPEQIELTYMGLIEEIRGLGLAKEIIRYAKQTALRRQRAFLTTSVDERNTMALKAYLSNGFTAWDRKTVYAKFPEISESKTSELHAK